MKAVSIFLTVLLFISCDAVSSKGDPDALPIVTANDFDVTIAENPVSDQVIGTIDFSTTNVNNHRFHFISENNSDSISGHVNLNMQTGTLIPYDSVFFDFEKQATYSQNAMLIGFNPSDISDTAFFKITIRLTDVAD